MPWTSRPGTITSSTVSKKRRRASGPLQRP
jgi:hypothetical protein